MGFWGAFLGIGTYDKYDLAKYCKEARILDQWTTKGMNLRKLAKQEKNMIRAIRQEMEDVSFSNPGLRPPRNLFHQFQE